MSGSGSKKVSYLGSTPAEVLVTEGLPLLISSLGDAATELLLELVLESRMSCDSDK